MGDQQQNVPPQLSYREVNQHKLRLRALDWNGLRNDLEQRKLDEKDAQLYRDQVRYGISRSVQNEMAKIIVHTPQPESQYAHLAAYQNHGYGEAARELTVSQRASNTEKHLNELIKEYKRVHGEGTMPTGSELLDQLQGIWGQSTLRSDEFMNRNDDVRRDNEQRAHRPPPQRYLHVLSDGTSEVRFFHPPPPQPSELVNLYQGVSDEELRQARIRSATAYGLTYDAFELVLPILAGASWSGLTVEQLRKEGFTPLELGRTVMLTVQQGILRVVTPASEEAREVKQQWEAWRSMDRKKATEEGDRIGVEEMQRMLVKCCDDILALKRPARGA